MEEKIFLPDTSAVIDGQFYNLLKSKKISGKVIIHKAVIAEIEHQANFGKDIGFVGLDEIKKIREFCKKKKIKFEYMGDRPTRYHIKGSKSGEIDALIRDAAWEVGATLVTCDKVQSKTGISLGMNVMFLEPITPKTKLEIDSFFDKNTMSVHIKEGNPVFAKKGFPGKWEFVQINQEILTRERVAELSKQVTEYAISNTEGFIELKRRGSAIVQIRDIRIVLTWPPFADGYEITAVRPVKRMTMNEYKMPSQLIERFEKSAEGILISGKPGAGKSTFAQALIEFYVKKRKIVKTVEAPRDLQVPSSVTQYSKNYGSNEEIHDVLLLSRPDYTVFDEMRNTSDFRLYSDLRLAGVGMAGVVHATTPIDAIQRFIGRIELGMIPHIVDTVVFIEGGFPSKIFELNMTVKVPSGMIEADLARPVVEIKDFLTKTLEFEIYAFGEETSIIPINKESKPTRNLASRTLEKDFGKIVSGNVSVEMPSDNKAVIYADEKDVPRLIGRKGERVSNLEKKYGLRNDIKRKKKKEANFDVQLGKKDIILNFDNELYGKNVDISIEGVKIFSSTIGKKGMIKIDKKTEVARMIKKAVTEGSETKAYL